MAMLAHILCTCSWNKECGKPCFFIFNFFLDFVITNPKRFNRLKQKTYNFNAKNSHTLYLGKFVKIGKKVEKKLWFYCRLMFWTDRTLGYTQDAGLQLVHRWTKGRCVGPALNQRRAILVSWVGT